MMNSHEDLEIDGNVIHDTEKAWLFLHIDDEEENKAVWLPKSQCEWADAAGKMTMPEWLASKHGWA